jgi:predicted TIM-barrel fold metal-dependent hydrolase
MVTTNQTNLAIPDCIKTFAGRIMDADAHEYTPVNHWIEQFGEATRPFVEAHENSKMPIRQFVAADDTAMDAATIWNTKFARAPGAFDWDRRLEVMDMTGVNRQLVFPGSIGLYATSFYFRADAFPGMYRSITGDRKAFALDMIRLHNDFCVRVARRSDRLRMVAVALAPDVPMLLAEAKRLVDAGVRAIWLPSAALPGGVSPAHPALDPLWDMCEAARITILAHVGADFEFLSSAEWRNAPQFEGWKAGEEFQMDPWTLSTLHLPVQNFVATMVLGGVFERFADLRFGACEVTAQWVGPLAENLDLWFANQRKFSLGNMEGDLRLSMKPSDYIRRNTRYSLFDIEPVDTYIRRYEMPEIYCYASDYPHPEGGRQPMVDVSARVAPFGQDVLQQVFVDNGAWLMPD